MASRTRNASSPAPMPAKAKPSSSSPAARPCSGPVALAEELGQGEQGEVMATRTGIEIRTARLVVRPVRASDDERLFHLFANWEVIRWLSSPPWPYTRADMQSFIREQAKPAVED